MHLDLDEEDQNRRDEVLKAVRDLPTCSAIKARIRRAKGVDKKVLRDLVTIATALTRENPNERMTIKDAKVQLKELAKKKKVKVEE